jgi:hypothetical protein
MHRDLLISQSEKEERSWNCPEEGEVASKEWYKEGEVMGSGLFIYVGSRYAAHRREAHGPFLMRFMGLRVYSTGRYDRYSIMRAETTTVLLN